VEGRSSAKLIFFERQPGYPCGRTKHASRAPYLQAGIGCGWHLSKGVTDPKKNKTDPMTKRVLTPFITLGRFPSRAQRCVAAVRERREPIHVGQSDPLRLPGRTLWEPRDNHQALGKPLALNLISAKHVAPEVSECDPCPGGFHHGDRHRLAEIVVGARKHGASRDGFVRAQHVFDEERRELLASPVNQLLEPASEKEIPGCTVRYMGGTCSVRTSRPDLHWFQSLLRELPSQLQESSRSR
jgi:hypothetical protein